MMLAKIKIKRNREEYFDSCIKVKDRPSAEGSRGCHALICLYSQSLMQENVMLNCPLCCEFVELVLEILAKLGRVSVGGDLRARPSVRTLRVLPEPVIRQFQQEHIGIEDDPSKKL